VQVRVLDAHDNQFALWRRADGGTLARSSVRLADIALLRSGDVADSS
jgi:hypothetical protein